MPKLDRDPENHAKHQGLAHSRAVRQRSTEGVSRSLEETRSARGIQGHRQESGDDRRARPGALRGLSAQPGRLGVGLGFSLHLPRVPSLECSLPYAP